MEKQCDYQLPSYFGYYSEIEGCDRAPCLLKRDHKGSHLIEGVSSYIEWERPEKCPEPEECADFLSCEHFEFSEIEIEDAQKRLREEGPSS